MLTRYISSLGVDSVEVDVPATQVRVISVRGVEDHPR